MIPLLAPIFQGPLAPLGETLQCEEVPPTDAVRLDDLVRAPGMLSQALHDHARQWPAPRRDLRPVASAWSMHYLSTLLPPVVAAASVLEHVFPLAPDQIWLSLGPNGAPVSFHILTLGHAMHGSSTAARYDLLVQQHLPPLFSALSELSGLPLKTLWGNTARHLESILDQALLLTGGAPSVALDRAMLLGTMAKATAPFNEHHPLRAPKRQVLIQQQHGGHAELIQLHPQCCLYHLLPGQSYCGACPLAPRSQAVRAGAAGA